MSTQSEEWRKRAADDRAAADKSALPNAKAKLIQSAERFEQLAMQTERVDRLKQDRNA